MTSYLPWRFGPILLGANLVTAQLAAQTAGTPPPSSPPSRPTGTSEPFGLHMGMSRAQLKVRGLIDSTQQFILSVTPPRAHPRFETYAALVTPKTGLCKIIAVGVTVETSVYGEELKSEFENIRGSLETRYGPGQTADFLKSGSIWDEPRDWMMGLLEKERVLSAFWTGDSLPKDISAIQLEARAQSSNRGWLRLVYEFSNFEACTAEMKSKERDVF